MSGDTVDLREHFKDLLDAQYNRISDRIEAEEQKAILRDERIMERVDNLTQSIARIDLAEIRRVVLAEAVQVAQREALAAVDARVTELRVGGGKMSGWVSGNEALVRIAVTGGIGVVAMLAGAVLAHFLGK